jgi:WD40 repeat protein
MANPLPLVGLRRISRRLFGGEAHQGWIRALDVSPDGTLVATAGNDLPVKVWNMPDGTLGHSLAEHGLGRLLVSGDLMGRYWRARALLSMSRMPSRDW